MHPCICMVLGHICGVSEVLVIHVYLYHLVEICTLRINVNNRLLITVQASSSPASSDEGPSTEEDDDLSADVSWMVESEGSESISTVQASSSSAAVPLWKRVGTYVHRVLGRHFQNIRDKVTQCVGSPPVRPRANAPFAKDPYGCMDHGQGVWHFPNRSNL